MKKAILLILFGLLIPACGWIKPAKLVDAGAQPQSQSQPQAQAAAPAAPEGLAASFELRIVPAGADTYLPDPTFDLKTTRKTDPIIASGEEIEFKNNVLLPDAKDPKALYLVWAGDWLGAQIHSVHVDHRFVNERGELDGAVVSYQPKYDAATRRWFLPISAFVSNEAAGADPSLQHALTFYLNLSDGSLKILNVRMRIAGIAPLPQVREYEASSSYDLPIPEFLGRSMDHTQAVQNWLANGVWVHGTDLVNNAQRKVKVWVRAPSDSQLQMEIPIGQVTYHQDSLMPYSPEFSGRFLAPPTPNDMSWSVSKIPARIAAVRAKSGMTQITKTWILKPGEWQSFDLEPREAFALEWLALPVAGQVHCVLPATSVRHISWTDIHKPAPDCGDPFSALCDQEERVYQDLSEPWVLGGLKVTGHWEEEWSVSNPWQSVPGQVQLKPQELSVYNGVLGGGSAVTLGSCQGVF